MRATVSDINFTIYFSIVSRKQEGRSDGKNIKKMKIILVLVLVVALVTFTQANPVDSRMLLFLVINYSELCIKI